MTRAAIAVLLTFCAATAAHAAPLTLKEARKAVFATGRVTVDMLPGSGLSATDQALLAPVAEAQPYYGAVAISPDEGLLSEATVAAANHHSSAAAEAAALADCNARKTAGAICVIVALIRPEGYAPRPLQLSRDATAALRTDYPARGGALAISGSTGLWGVGKGPEAAVAACAGKGRATDCVVVVQD